MAKLGMRGKGWLFALPWLIGLGAFTLYPFCASIYYSFTDFSVLQESRWIGAANYGEIAGDEVFWKVLGNTLFFAALSIPAGLLVSLSLALLMNATRRGQALYSVIFYLPHLVPVVAAAMLWLWIFNSQYGLLNNALRPFYDLLNFILQRRGETALVPPAWLTSTTWALPSLVLMGLWSAGQAAFIYLATLQDVPVEMYEAADIDGASTWQKIRYISLPMISHIIFFNVIMGLIGAFQVFSEPYIMTKGGPAQATYFLPYYIFDNAFVYLRMGYACAMSWLLFLIILALTLLAIRLSRGKIFYAGR